MTPDRSPTPVSIKLALLGIPGLFALTFCGVGEEVKSAPSTPTPTSTPTSTPSITATPSPVRQAPSDPTDGLAQWVRENSTGPQPIASVQWNGATNSWVYVELDPAQLSYFDSPGAAALAACDLVRDYFVETGLRQPALHVAESKDSPLLALADAGGGCSRTQ